MNIDRPRFDESLDVLLDSIKDLLGDVFLKDGVAVRDGIGRLSFVCAENAPKDIEITSVEFTMRERLGAYARDDMLLRFADSTFAGHVLNSSDKLFIQTQKNSCWLIDRRVVGAGWLAEPRSTIASPPRIIFASLKGGVGRSTALAVTAFDMAVRGKNVLVVDLDLEAPGLGELLLPPDRVPKYGVLDYLVERGLGGHNDDLSDYIGTSPLTMSGGGVVDVLPVLGAASNENPQNVLPKLARAVLENTGVNGDTASLGAKFGEMIDAFASIKNYDLVLIDSRAGLAEISAPAVLGLGGVVLLFGTAQHQTIAGYRSLFAGLKLLATKSLASGKNAEWRFMLKPVYAKASLEPGVARRYQAELYDLFADNIYDEDDGTEVGKIINFGASEPSAPHMPLVIPFESRFADFDPHYDVDHIGRAFYEQTFRPFLQGIDALLRDLSGEDEEGNL